MYSDVFESLQALEDLAANPSTSSSGPLNVLLDSHLSVARDRLNAGSDPKQVIVELQKNVIKAKKDTEKGLKNWYTSLGSLGKSVDKSFPSNLSSLSSDFDDPPLFSQPPFSSALDRAILASLGRRGLWEAVEALQDETGLVYDDSRRDLSGQLQEIIGQIENGDPVNAIKWCEENEAFLSAPPHPSSLPYHLHRAVFLSLPPSEALVYARAHLFTYVPTQPVLPLITSCLYPPSTSTSSLDPIPNSDISVKPNQDVEQRNSTTSPYHHANAPLTSMFRDEFCRRHGLPKEDPLAVAVDLGSRGQALNVIEKARRVMGDHVGSVRTWQELPIEVPLPSTRRYHSVFVCPVSKEQATESNPPMMLSCGHVIAEESLNRLLKGGRRSVKCPYCPVETSPQAAQRLYF